MEAIVTTTSALYYFDGENYCKKCLPELDEETNAKDLLLSNDESEDCECSDCGATFVIAEEDLEEEEEEQKPVSLSNDNSEVDLNVETVEFDSAVEKEILSSDTEEETNKEEGNKRGRPRKVIAVTNEVAKVEIDIVKPEKRNFVTAPYIAPIEAKRQKRSFRDLADMELITPKKKDNWVW